MMMMNPTHIRGMIFDYGGTIDSHGDHWSHVIREGYEAAGLKVGIEDFREAYVYAERELARNPHILPSHNFYQLMLIKVEIEIGRLIELKAATLSSLTLAPQIALYCYRAAQSAVGEAKEVLSALSTRYPMVLVSNFYGNIHTILADFGIDRFFQTVIESAVVGVRKPDPAIFALGVEALHLPAGEVLVVGDSLTKDIAPAASLGCRTAWIEGRPWEGDGKKSVSASVSKPDVTITSLTELLPILNRGSVNS